MSAAYTTLCRSLLFPAHEFVKRHRSVALRRELEFSQWKSPDEIQALQVQNLRQFLVKVGKSVPYYRRMFDSVGFEPEALQSVLDLAALPFLSKSLIRENAADLRAESAGKLVRYNTGGSSGEPLVFFMGRDRISHDVAAKWRATRWWDVDIGDPEVVLWGSPIEIGKQDRIKGVRDRILRSHLLPAFQMSAAQMDVYLDRIKAIRPRMLFGYASALALLSSHARTRGRDMRKLDIKVVFSTGETLYDSQREVIEGAFGAPVANGYGSRDAGFIAHQCPSGSMHISAEHILVELVGDGGAPVGAGEIGEIVVTHLATQEFPFIRYRTGDMAVRAASPCGCGRGLPLLEKVMGRSTDFIHTPDGNAMHALALIYVLRDKPGIGAFKIVQAEDYSLDVRIVVGPSFSGEVEKSIADGLAERMGPASVVRIIRVADIPPEKSGKYRYVESKVSAAAIGQASS